MSYTFATNFLVYGIGDVYELSRLLGHSDLKITDMYLQLASYYMIIEKRHRISYLDMKR
jgi:site-specific recombinase XerD